MAGIRTRETFQKQMVPLQVQMEGLLRQGANSGIRDLAGSCRDILGHTEALWAFVTVQGVPPTNNHAERE